MCRRSPRYPVLRVIFLFPSRVRKGYDPGNEVEHESSLCLFFSLFCTRTQITKDFAWKLTLINSPYFTLWPWLKNAYAWGQTCPERSSLLSKFPTHSDVLNFEFKFPTATDSVEITELLPNKWLVKQIKTTTLLLRQIHHIAQFFNLQNENK